MRLRLSDFEADGYELLLTKPSIVQEHSQKQHLRFVYLCDRTKLCKGDEVYQLRGPAGEVLIVPARSLDISA